MMLATVKTAPVEEPVSVEELKSHLRITQDAEDLYLYGLLKAARTAAESFTRRAFISTVYEGYLQHVPTGLYFSVIPGPVSAIASIKYYAADHTESTWASTNYHLDVTASPNRVWLRDGCLWPTSTRVYQPMLVNFTAGYGAAASSVPEAIKHAIKVMASEWWENRVPEDSTTDIPEYAKSLLMKYRYLFFGVEE